MKEEVFIKIGRYLYRNAVKCDPNSGRYQAMMNLGGYENLYDQYRNYGVKTDDLCHTFITGGTSSGKSELIKSLVFQRIAYDPDATQIIIDPEGTLSDQVARFNNISSDQILCIDSSEKMNILDSGGDSHTVINMLKELLGDQDAITSAMKRVLKPCIETLILRPDSTLHDLLDFMDSSTNTDLIDYAKNLPNARNINFIENKLNNVDARTRGGIESRIDNLLDQPMVDDFICGSSTFDLNREIKNKKLIVFDLSDDKTYAVGRMIIAKIASLLENRGEEDSSKNPVLLYVDEAHEFITPSIEFIVRRLRKRGLFLTLATQGAMGSSSMDREIQTNMGLFVKGTGNIGEFEITRNNESQIVKCEMLHENCYVAHREPELLDKKESTELIQSFDPKDQVVEALKKKDHLTVDDFIALGIKDNKQAMNRLLAKMKGDNRMIVEHKLRDDGGHKQRSTYTLRKTS